ncbi:uncharacterized protein VP01_5099g1, partial [Puccinia sorghi]
MDATEVEQLKQQMENMMKGFEGTRGIKTKTYSVHVALYFSANPSMFPVDRFKIKFSTSYPQAAGPSHYATGYWKTNWPKPSRTTTSHQSGAGTAGVEGEQFSGNYTHTFVTLALELGWEVPKHISIYTQGLKKDIQLGLILGRIEFCTVVE